MLGRYLALDPEDDSPALRELHAMLDERGRRQQGCYFFSRVRGEGVCVWTSALEALREGVFDMMDRLGAAQAALARDRAFTEDVIDLCAMYVSWAEQRTLPRGHSLPEDILAGAIRDPREGGDLGLSGKPPLSPKGEIWEKGKEMERVQGAFPPMPSRGPSNVTKAKHEYALAPISHFVQDDLALKVIRHMFQLAQVALEEEAANPNAKKEKEEKEEGISEDVSIQIKQLEEQVELLKKGVALAEKRASEAERLKITTEEERNRAQSEAAFARAELRRLKRISVNAEKGKIDSGRGDSAVVSSRTMSSVTGAKKGGKAESRAEWGGIEEVARYARALSDELNYAKSLVSDSHSRKGGTAEAAKAEIRRTGDSSHRGGSSVGGGDPLIDFQERLAKEYRTLLHVVAEPEVRSYAKNFPQTTRANVGDRSLSRSWDPVRPMREEEVRVNPKNHKKVPGLQKSRSPNVVMDAVVRCDSYGRVGYSERNVVDGRNLLMNSSDSSTGIRRMTRSSSVGIIEQPAQSSFPSHRAVKQSARQQDRFDHRITTGENGCSRHLRSVESSIEPSSCRKQPTPSQKRRLQSREVDHRALPRGEKVRVYSPPRSPLTKLKKKSSPARRVDSSPPPPRSSMPINDVYHAYNRRDFPQPPLTDSMQIFKTENRLPAWSSRDRGISPPVQRHPSLRREIPHGEVSGTEDLRAGALRRLAEITSNTKTINLRG
ncbi:unnamed protein product [Phytomonas sp. Hart1]|nr:unnamed protein product [Phytomonas sp. Hart1]|eukprot:CCW69099.1 unnamed protein product [Phytomonas sp. isolate Hart1]